MQFIKKHKTDFIILTILIALGIVLPVLWLKGGYVVAGHDAGLPFDPIKHFTNRFYVWTERIGFGADQSHELGAVPIHGFEALLAWLLPNPHVAQLAMFSFWLILPGVMMFILTRSIFGSRRWLLILFASLFYSYNHFLLQAWWIFERTKFTLYAALPMVVLLIIKLLQEKISVLTASICFALLLFFLNGGGFAPLFGAVIVAIIVTIIFGLWINFSFGQVKRLVSFLALSGLFMIPLNAYWILPYLILLRESFQTGLSQIGGVDNVLEWANYISQDASVLNLLRLRGIVDWSANELHPYAAVFNHNPVFVLISYCLAPLAIVSILLAKTAKEKTLLALFAFIGFVAMLFIGGTHHPFGFIFSFLIEKVPGFVVFRSPYYKFAPALWFAYAIMIGHTLSHFYEKLSTIRLSKTIKTFFVICIFGIFALYNYPYFSGVFFDYMKNKRSTRIKVPSYIYDVDHYITKEHNDARLLLLPRATNSLNADTYIWKYWSLAPVTSLLSNSYSVTNRNNDMEAEVKLVDDMFDAMENHDEVWKKILFNFGVDTAILRRDFAIPEDSTQLADLRVYDQLLDNKDAFSHEKQVGLWDFFAIDNHLILPTIAAMPNTVYVDGYIDRLPLLTYADFKSLFALKQINNRSDVVIAELQQPDKVVSDQFDTIIAPYCSYCTQQDFIEQLYFKDRILPNSILFPLIKHQEVAALAAAHSQAQREVLLTEIFKKRIFALKYLRESKQTDFTGMGKVTAALQDAYAQYRDSLSTLTYDARTDVKRTQSAIDLMYTAKEQIVKRLQENVFQSERATLVAILDQIDAFLQVLYDRANRSTTENEKNYVFNLKQPGLYQMILKRSTLSNTISLQELSLTQLSIDKQPIQLHIIPAGGDWYSLGQTYLGTGRHLITALDITPKNIFSITDDMKQKNKDLTFSQTGFSFSASSLNQTCADLPVTNLVPGEVYKIAFTYTISDSSRRLLFTFDKDALTYGKIISKANYLAGSDSSKDFEVKEIASSSTIHLHFCSEYFVNDTVPKYANFTVSSIELAKLSKPKLLLSWANVDQNQAPIVYFERINPTQYHIRVKAPTDAGFMLTFAERFNTRWKLYPVKTNWSFINLTQVNPGIPSYKVNRHDQFYNGSIWQAIKVAPVTEDHHFLVNGFANGWWIDGNGSLDYLLLYDKQLRYYVGVSISVGAIVIVTVLVVFLVYRKKRKNHHAKNHN